MSSLDEENLLKYKLYTMNIIRSIQNRIYEIRGERVMLDFDLAALYGVETKALNQAVKRNSKRFPPDFMFQLTAEEWDHMWSQFVTTSGSEEKVKDSWSQTVTSSRKHRPKTALPYAFTEQGVAMLSGVLNSEKAINMNIAIMRAFVEIKRLTMKQGDIREELKAIQQRIGEHDTQLSAIYDAIENLLDDTAAQRKWDNRERIGFKK